MFRGGDSGSSLKLHSRRRFPTRRDELRERLAAIQQQLRERLEKRGRLSEQLAALSADKQLAAKHLELAVVEKRLEEAIGRWQVLAVTCRLLGTIAQPPTSSSGSRRPCRRPWAIRTG